MWQHYWVPIRGRTVTAGDQTPIAYFRASCYSALGTPIAACKVELQYSHWLWYHQSSKRVVWASLVAQIGTTHWSPCTMTLCTVFLPVVQTGKEVQLTAPLLGTGALTLVAFVNWLSLKKSTVTNIFPQSLFFIEFVVKHVSN